MNKHHTSIVEYSVSFTWSLTYIMDSCPATQKYDHVLDPHRRYYRAQNCRTVNVIISSFNR
jgi:hypothetical protein